MNNATVKPVNAPQFGFHGKDRLVEARKRRDEAQTELNSAHEYAKKLDGERTARAERHKQAEYAISMMISSMRGREAIELTECEISILLEELSKAREFQDKIWISKKLLNFTNWRGMKMLRLVEESLEKAFHEKLPDDVAEKLARLIEKQETYLRECAKKEGVLRPNKTKRDKTSGAHAKHAQNRATAAVEQSSTAKMHCGGGKK